MLVIISDLHLSDGTSGKTVHQGTLRVFRERLRALAYAASWRRDGKYKPIGELDVILLGDILDVMRSTRWLQDEPGAPASVRPWDISESSHLINKISSITDAVLSHNAVFFTMLKELRNTAIVTLPQTRPSGQPVLWRHRADGDGRVPVKVRIHYMVGNHDWFYHLPHAAYSDIRRRIVEALGLENDPSQPFPHDAEEPFAAGIQQALERHQVFARHGDVFDPVNYAGNRDTASAGDAIVIDLVTRFGFELQARLGHLLPPECLAGMTEIDNVRPVILVPAWISGLLRRTCPSPSLRHQVQEMWNELVTQVFRGPFVRERMSSSPLCGKARTLKWALILSKRLMQPRACRWTYRLAEKIGNPRRPYFPHALRERWLLARRARFIVYGHTHHHEIVPLGASISDGGMLEQIYVNSGCWRPVYDMVRSHPPREEFIGYHSMTYLAFFKDDERGGRRFECWSGGLSGSPGKTKIRSD